MWWKYLTIALLLYVFTFGMLVPLKPGLENVSPSIAKVGQSIDLRVKGYNTTFQEGASDARAWLKYDDSHAILATSIRVENNQIALLHFDLPSTLPEAKKNGQLTLIMDDPKTGTSILPAALMITSDSLSAAAEPLWSALPNALNVHSGFAFPYRNILNETIRNLYYHVPLWFAMIAIFTASLWYSIVYLRNSGPDGDYAIRQNADLKASSFAEVGLIYGILGLTTGMIWANYTWGAPWSSDVKQNMSAVLLMVYFAYVILRLAFDEEQKAARISAVYNIFAYASIFPLLFVIPRMVDSLHPGNGGNPAMGGEDLDNTMRLVFYPGVIAFALLGFWIAQVIFRIKRLKAYQEELDVE